VTHTPLRLLLLALCLALPAQAQNKYGAPQNMPPSMNHDASRALQERKDILAWSLLAQVELVRLKDRYVPQFSSNVEALDRKEVKLQGFMMPLQTGDKQTHFVLSAMPASCPYCLPGGPEQLVEVKSKTPVRYTLEPMVLSGRFAVLKDEPSGVFYRLTDAVLTK
jgi:hypothetical protein